MKNRKYLSAAEYALMTILWNSEKPLSYAEIIEQRIEGTWALKSFYPLINNLIDKEFVRVDGSIKVSKTSSRLYAANVSASEYTAMQLNEAFKDKKAFGLAGFLSHFAKDDEVPNEDLVNELEQWIEDNKS